MAHMWILCNQRPSIPQQQRSWAQLVCAVPSTLDRGGGVLGQDTRAPSTCVPEPRSPTSWSHGSLARFRGREPREQEELLGP